MFAVDSLRAIVTGGAAGIGEAVASQLARNGARVLVVDMHLERAQRVAQTAGENAIAHRADVTSADEVAGLVAKAESLLGGVDVLVNVAGGSLVRQVRSMTDEEWARMIDLNLKSVFLCCRAVIPLME